MFKKPSFQKDVTETYYNVGFNYSPKEFENTILPLVEGVIQDNNLGECCLVKSYNCAGHLDCIKIPHINMLNFRSNDVLVDLLAKELSLTKVFANKEVLRLSCS